MASNIPRQQRTAARMVAAGYTDTHVMKEFNIRYSTFVRWRQSPVFLEELHYRQNEIRRSLSLKLIRLMDDCVDATSSAISMDEEQFTVDKNNVRILVSLFKTFEKQMVIDSPYAKEGLKPPKTTPKNPKTLPKNPEKTQKPPINSEENTSNI